MADKNYNADNKAQFDTESDVNLSMEQLSYICEYCGKVNAIGAANCVRCGKRRPRNQYLKAMSRLQNSKSVREQYIAEQAIAAEDKKEAAQQQVVRLVENRVADEKAQILAQEELRLEQEREAIKKATARDAVLRVVAAENAAEEKVLEAERRADEILQDRNREIDELIAAEREKALDAAAEKLVAERAGIEEVAKDKVEANRKATERYATERIMSARNEADKVAARQAVLQIIAAEQAADEKLRMSKTALQQAAVERIVEERILADKEAAARYAAEKQAIERAADDRIKAEREAVKRILGDRGVSYNNDNPAGVQQVQPIAIVPYLNPNQPVNQYNPERVVYRFIPDENQPQPVYEEYSEDYKGKIKKQKKKKF